MMITAVADLRQEETWDPFVLASRSIRWPQSDWPERQLGDVGEVVTPTGWAEKGTPVIVPALLDWQSGWFRKRSTNYFGSAYQIGLDVTPGDILVPRSDAPVLLVDDSLLGSLASSRFVAIRPLPGLSLWLWGVLNSLGGRMHRSLLSSASSVSDFVDLLRGLAVPIPPLGALDRVSGQIASVAATVDRIEEEAPASWWGITDLREYDWQLALATPHPERVVGDFTLGDLAVIEPGRRVPDAVISEGFGESLVPVVDVAVLSGGDVKEWVPDGVDELVYAEPGNVLIVTTGPRARATVVTERCAFEGSMLCIRPRDVALAPAIAHYFNTGPGVALRKMFQTGTAIPALSLSNARRLPISATDLHDYEPQAEAPITLTAQLESVLWN